MTREAARCGCLRLPIAGRASRNLLNFGCDRSQRFRERIVNLFGIGDHNALAFSENNVTGNSDNSGVVRHIAQHY